MQPDCFVAALCRLALTPEWTPRDELLVRVLILGIGPRSPLTKTGARGMHRVGSELQPPAPSAPSAPRLGWWEERGGPFRRLALGSYARIKHRGCGSIKGAVGIVGIERRQQDHLFHPNNGL